MNYNYIWLIAGAVALLIILYIATQKNYNLDSIKNKTVGDGQHGTARWLSESEAKRQYRYIDYDVDAWRSEGKMKLEDADGILVGVRGRYPGKVKTFLETEKVHAMMIASPGAGKTAYFLYPNIEYACAAGMSFFCTDTKGDIYRKYGTIAKKYYGYHITVIDLRDPTHSNAFNILQMTNKYMDTYKRTKELADVAKAEKYAKITAKTIIGDTENFGQNAYFYDAAEGLITACILIISEFAPKEKRHIVSVYKMIQDLMAPATTPAKTTNRFQMLMDRLPDTHKAKWFAGAAINAPQQSMSSVLTTALSKLNAFLDSEMEQILCSSMTQFDTERFCSEKSAFFVVVPEEDNSKYFMVSLILQQLYRELMLIADSQQGILQKKVMMYLDEFGTIPKITAAEMMFSASRSRNIGIVAIIQSTAQLEEKYGKEGSQNILDNCALTIAGGFAPNSRTAEDISKALGSKTVLSGSVTRSEHGSQSLQMIERPLMTADELRRMPNGQFVVLKRGSYPMKSRFQIFTKWGVKFEENYDMSKRRVEEIQYIDIRELERAISEKYPKQVVYSPVPKPTSTWPTQQPAEQQYVVPEEPPKPKRNLKV